MKTLKLAISILATLFASTAIAAGTGTGTFLTPYAMPGGQVIVYTSTAPAGQPACATSARFAIDGTTAGGKVQNSWIEMAFAMNKLVTVIGAGTCTVQATSEDISYFVIAN